VFHSACAFSDCRSPRCFGYKIHELAERYPSPSFAERFLSVEWAHALPRWPSNQEKFHDEERGRFFYQSLLLAAGSLLCAVAVRSMIMPHDFLARGRTGFALLIFYKWPVLPIGLLYLLTLSRSLYWAGASSAAGLWPIPCGA